MNAANFLSIFSSISLRDNLVGNTEENEKEQYK